MACAASSCFGAAAGALACHNEFFFPEDEDDVRVCDLMQGMLTSYGLQQPSDGVYVLDLHMY